MYYLILIPFAFIFVSFAFNAIGSAIRTETRKNERARISEEKDRFWVQVGLMDGYAARLTDIEKLLKARDTVQANRLLDEWKWRYAQYRQLALKLHRWNDLIKLKEPFTGSKTQCEAETQLFININIAFAEGETARAQYAESQQAIFDYLKAEPYHCAYRAEMLSALSKKDKERRAQLDSDYKYMIKTGVLLEIKETNGKYVVHKASYRQKRAPKLAASVYDPERYRDVDRRTELKIEYTVAFPTNVDHEKNTGEFYSISRGDHYYTSLERCTCPMYGGSGRYPCKHMVALANHLGYYKPGTKLIQLSRNHDKW